MALSKIELISNLKVITSGAKPTAGTDIGQLDKGQMAFGPWTTDHGGDNKYHIYGNVNGSIRDIVLDSIGPVFDAFDLMSVLTNGNVAEDISIILKGIDKGFEAEDGDFSAKLTGTGVEVKRGVYTTRVIDDGITILNVTDPADPVGLVMNNIQGFMDKGNTALTGNPERAYTPAEVETMREKLNVPSLDDIAGKLNQVFDYKGICNRFDELPTDAKTGDVYQVTDRESKLYAWVIDNAGNGKWEILGFILDLSNYYDRDEIDSIVSKLETDLLARIVSLEGRMDRAEGDILALDGRQTATEDGLASHIIAARMHSTNDYTDEDKLKVAYLATKDSGTGYKVLNDNGDYVEVVLVIDQC